MNIAAIKSILISTGILLAALLIVPYIDSAPAGLILILQYASYPAVILAMILSVFFNQSRLFFVLYVTGIYLLLILGEVQLPEYFSSIDGFKFIQLVFLLYLSTLLYFLFAKDRGIFTLKGFSRLIACSLIAVIPLFLATEQTYLSTRWLSVTVFPQEISQLLPLSDITVALYLFTMAVVLLRLLLKSDLAESSFFALLSGAGLSLYFYPDLFRVEFIFFITLVIVLLFIIRNSIFLAYRDELTGLAGRRLLKDQMNNLGSSFSIAMVDIDHFKKFNDRYGHDAGDQVLRMVADKINRTGCGSKAYRYGGEEFTLVFSGKSVSDVLPCLESLRNTIADEIFILRGKGRKKNKTSVNKKTHSKKNNDVSNAVQVTVSIGVADINGTGNTASEVIKISDKALYRAKKKGRNRVSK